MGAIGLAMARIHAVSISFDRPPHADGVDARRSGERADRDGHVVPPPFEIDHVGEQKCAPLIFAQPALELPAHQRMQLGVLVDRPLDAYQEPCRFEPRQMLLEIQWRTPRLFFLLPRGAHRGWSSIPQTGYFFFFWYSAMIGRVTRKQSTPFGTPQ